MPPHAARLLTSLTLAAAAAACTPMSQIANGTAPWAPPSMQTPLPELTRQNRLAADPDTALDPLYPRPGYTYAVHGVLGTRIEYFAPNGIVHSWRRGFSHVRVAGYTYVGWPTQLPNGEKYYHSILFQMAPLAFFTGDEWERKDFGPAIGSAISREIAGKSVISYAASDIFGLAKTHTAPFALDGCTVPRPMIQAKAFTRPTPEQILRAQGAGIETTLVALCP